MFKKTTAFIAALAITASAASVLPYAGEANVLKVSAAEETSSLPSKVDLTTDPKTKDFFPEIGDQGNQGACTAFSSTYYQFTYEARKAYYEKYGKIADFTFSPAFTYNNSNGGKDDGSTLEKAFSVLEKQGALSLDDCQFVEGYGDVITKEQYEALSEDEKKWYSVYNKKAETYIADDHAYRTHIRDEKLLLKALKTRLKKYDSFYTNKKNEDETINKIKETLSQGKIITTEGTFSYRTSKGKSYDEDTNRVAVINSDSEEWAFVQNIDVSSGVGGHAFTIVGYDDNVKVKYRGKILQGAFKIANSWSDDYNNDGFIWIMYDAFYKESKEGIKWTGEKGKRVPAFDGNFFFTMDVEVDKDIKLVAETDVITNNICNYHTYISNSENSKEYTGYNGNRKDNSNSSVYSGPVLIDMTDICNGDYYNRTYTLKFGSSKYGTYFTAKSVKIMDDLGNVVAEKTVDNNTENYFAALRDNDKDALKKYSKDICEEITLDLQIGDVNYDGVYNDKDFKLIKNFADGEEYSLFQKELMDFNNDGIFTYEDVDLAENALYWTEDGKYKGQEGVVYTGWHLIDGSYYFLDENGYKVTNSFIEDENKGVTLFVDEEGRQVADRRFAFDGKQYYADNNGYIVKDREVEFFIYGVDRIYYYDENGAKVIGWNSDNTKYYSDAGMLTGTHTIDGVSYTFDENGVLVQD